MTAPIDWGEDEMSSNEEPPAVTFEMLGGAFHWGAGTMGELARHMGPVTECPVCEPPAGPWCAPSETLAAVGEPDDESLVDLDSVMASRAARRQDELTEELIRAVPGLRAAQAVAVAKMLMDRYKLMDRNRYDQAIEALL